MYKTLLVIILALVLINLYIYFRRKKFTRERFAFFSSLLLFSFAGTVLSHIFADKSLIRIIAEFYNLLPVTDIEIHSTSWSDKLWSIIILIILAMFFKAVISEWDGAKSKYDLQLAAQKRDLNLYQTIIRGASLRKIDQQSEDDFISESNKSRQLDYLDDDLDWHTEVKELLKMSSRQYKILESDWHSSNNLYISKYSEKNIVIICSTQDIDAKLISEKIRYANSLAIGEIYKILVCVKLKNSEPSRKIKIPNYNIDLEYIYKSQLLDGLVNFEDYYEYIDSQYYKEEISAGDGVCISDIYVPSRGKTSNFTDDDSHLINNVGDYLLSWVKNNSYEKQISLLGDYGQGKSVLSLWLAKEMIASNCDRIPIIIELRGKSPRNETLPNIISGWAIRFHIDPMAIQKLLQEGRLLIILEGFDELDMIGDSNRRLEHFKRLWEFARYKRSKVLITGRPNLFLNNEEIKNYLHVDSTSSTLFYSEAIILLPFSKEQIIEGLRSTKTRIKSEMLNVLSRSQVDDSFLDLISRPSTLYQASIIWDNLDKNSLNSASVIREFITHAYKRQEEKLRDIGKTGIEPPVLTNREREYFMSGVAIGMAQRNGYSNQINRSELEVIISRLYFNIPKDVSDDHIGSISLKDRMKDNREVIQSIFNDVRTSGILVRDLTTNDSFKFAHKSFLEFLVANFFVEYMVDEFNVSSNCIYKSNDIDNIFTLEYSSETISHITNLIISHNKFHFDDQNPCLVILKLIQPKLTYIDKIFFKKSFFMISLYNTLIFFIFFPIVLAIYSFYLNFDASFALMVQLPIILLVVARLPVSIITGNYKNAFFILDSCCDAIAREHGISSIISTTMISHFKKYKEDHMFVFPFADNPGKLFKIFENTKNK